jgi:hypothetical protein
VTRVEVNANGRHVIVDQDGRDAEMLAKQAFELWRDTDKASPVPTGFITVAKERTDA